MPRLVVPEVGCGDFQTAALKVIEGNIIWQRLGAPPIVSSDEPHLRDMFAMCALPPYGTQLEKMWPCSNKPILTHSYSLEMVIRYI